METKILRNALSEQEIAKYTEWNPGYIATGDTIEISFKDRYGLNYSETLVIFASADSKHNWTPYGTARQTKNHIIVARHDRYWKFTLDGEIVNRDACDNDSNQ